MQVKFIEFRGAQIGLIEIKGCPHGVIKYGSDQVGVCSVSEHNRKAMWATDGKLGIKLISKRNALLCVMIEATKFVCRGRKWRDEYIDFPLDWDWFCPPDGELTAFLDESALITLKQINSAEVVDGVWLSQPTHSIVPLDDSRGECIKEIHNRRNDANPTRGLSMSYGGGFANGRGCFAELEGHPILSKLNPDLQFIIRHCTNSNGKNPDWVIENVIPYLVLTSRL